MIIKKKNISSLKMKKPTNGIDKLPNNDDKDEYFKIEKDNNQIVLNMNP